MEFSKLFQPIRESINRILQKFDSIGTTVPSIPRGVTSEMDETAARKASEDVAQYGLQLFEDAKQFRRDAFANTQHLRVSSSKLSVDEEYWWKECDQLAAGNHWETFGRRNADAGNEWKQERVDNKIGEQLRIRKSHLFGGWHEILITPNLNNVQQVFNQERRHNGWDLAIKQWGDAALRYGDGQLRIDLDRTSDERGIVRPLYCDKGTIYRSPYSVGYKKEEGCWYVVNVGMITDKQVESVYPDLDITKLASAKRNAANTAKDNKLGDKAYQQTRVYDKIEIFLDDFDTEPIPFTEEDQGKIEAENVAFMQGLAADVSEADHHIGHMMRHMEELENYRTQFPDVDDETFMELPEVRNRNQHMAVHIEYATKDDPSTQGWRYKYPHGRYICIIGGRLADDKPNPLKLDWHRLFFDLYNERSLGRQDGVGDVETLRHDNQTIDTMMSRIDDAGISVAMPKVVFSDDEDKEDIEANFNNNPTKPMFSKKPPTIIQGHMAPEWPTVLNLALENIRQRNGITDPVRGEEPFSGSSNALAQTLLQQSLPMVTGELNQNLNSVLEEVVSTMLDLMRIWYTEPREYLISGEFTPITVSEILSYAEPTKQEGEITKYEITVKPNSNLPSQWEWYLQFLVGLTQVPLLAQVLGGGLALAIIDHLAERFPDFGQNGKYYQQSQILMMVQGILAQQQQQQSESEPRRSLVDVQNQYQTQGAR